MCAFLTYAYDKFHNFFPHTGDGKSFTSLDGLRAHPNKSHLPKRPDCRDCCYKTNNAGHLKHHRDCWHNGTSQKVKKWRHKQWICTFHAHVYWQNECPHEERRIQGYLMLYGKWQDGPTLVMGIIPTISSDLLANVRGHMRRPVSAHTTCTKKSIRVHGACW